MLQQIPAGFSYNRKTGEYNDLYRLGTDEDLRAFTMKFFGIDKLMQDAEMMRNFRYGSENTPE